MNIWWSIPIGLIVLAAILWLAMSVDADFKNDSDKSNE